MRAVRLNWARDAAYPEVRRALPALAVAVRYPLARQYGPEMRFLRSCGQFDEDRRRAWNREAHREAVLAEVRGELAYWVGFRAGYDAGKGGTGCGALDAFDRIRALETAHGAIRFILEERPDPHPMRERWRRLYRSVRGHPEDHPDWVRRLFALATGEGR